MWHHLWACRKWKFLDLTQTDSRDIAIAPWPCPVLEKSVQIRIFSSKPKVLIAKTLCCVEVWLFQAWSVSSLSSSSKWELGHSMEGPIGDPTSFLQALSYHDAILLLFKQNKTQQNSMMRNNRAIVRFYTTLNNWCLFIKKMSPFKNSDVKNMCRL